MRAKDARGTQRNLPRFQEGFPRFDGQSSRLYVRGPCISGWAKKGGDWKLMVHCPIVSSRSSSLSHTCLISMDCSQDTLNPGAYFHKNCGC